MPEDPNREDQRKKLRETECTDDSFVVNPFDTLPARRKDDDCSDPVERLPDTEFIEPEDIECPPPPPPLDPEPLLIGNDFLSLTCTEFTGGDATVKGDPVNVLESTFTDLVFFTNIEDLTDAQQNQLATLDNAQRDALITATVAEIKNLTILTTTQAQQLRDDIDEVKNNLNASAQAAAENAIECFWENVAITCPCPDDTDQVPQVPALKNSDLSAPNPLVNNPVTIPAGTLTSTESQADADAQALEVCEATRRCAYGNQLIEVTCPLPPDGNPVPNVLTIKEDGTTSLFINLPGGVDPAEANPSIGRPRIGKVIIEPNVFISTETVADANNQANEFAITQLDCFYVNKEIRVWCHKPGVPLTIDALEGTDPNPNNHWKPLIDSWANSDILVGDPRFNKLGDEGTGDLAVEFRTLSLTDPVYPTQPEYQSGNLQDYNSILGFTTERYIDIFAPSENKRDTIAPTKTPPGPEFGPPKDYTQESPQLSMDLVTFTHGRPGDLVNPYTIRPELSGNPAAAPASFTEIHVQGVDPLIVAEATVTSTISDKDANNQAVVFGDTQLECYWENPDMYLVCPSETIRYDYDSDGDLETITGWADPALSPVYKLFIPKGTFRSTISLLDALQLAVLSSQAALDCVYCNLFFEAICATTSDPPTPDDKSINRSDRVPYAGFCFNNFLLSMETARAEQLLPDDEKTEKGVVCTWANVNFVGSCFDLGGDERARIVREISSLPKAQRDALEAAVSTSVTYDPVDPDTVSGRDLLKLRVSVGGFCPDVEFYLANSDPLLLGHQFSARFSSPGFDVFGDSEYVVVGQGTITGTTSQAAVDAQALELLSTQLNCAWSNGPARVPCPGCTFIKETASVIWDIFTFSIGGGGSGSVCETDIFDIFGAPENDPNNHLITRFVDKPDDEEACFNLPEFPGFGDGDGDEEDGLDNVKKGVLYEFTKTGYIPADTFVAFWQTGQTQEDANVQACTIAEGMRVCQGMFVPEGGSIAAKAYKSAICVQGKVGLVNFAISEEDCDKFDLDCPDFE
jgi:hypothetical protein